MGGFILWYDLVILILFIVYYWFIIGINGLLCYLLYLDDVKNKNININVNDYNNDDVYDDYFNDNNKYYCIIY